MFTITPPRPRMRGIAHFEKRKNPFQIHSELPVPIGRSQVRDLPSHFDSRIVHQDVERAEFLHREGYGLLHVIFAADVAVNGARCNQTRCETVHVQSGP
jgi:hypothetical protein